MSKITVKPTTMAGDQIIQDTLNAANSQMPADKKARSADIERDADGKVVAVHLNFDADADQADLDNAKSKINENSGVASTLTLPLAELTEDFESYTDGQNPGLVLGGYFDSTPNTDLPVINTTNPLSGTKDLKLGGISAVLRSHPNQFGLSSVKAAYTQFTVKDIQTVILNMGSLAGSIGPLLGSWRVFFANQARDLGVPFDPSKEITFKISASNSVWVFTMIVDGVEYTEIFTGAYGQQGHIEIRANSAFGNGTGQIDNIEFKILDGTPL